MSKASDLIEQMERETGQRVEENSGLLPLLMMGVSPDDIKTLSDKLSE